MAAVLALALAGCGPAQPGTAAVRLDAPAADVVTLGVRTVHAAPGDVVRIVNASPVVGDLEAPVTHALVGGTAALPPLFVEQPGGLIPTPAVWGPCRGGDDVGADGRCPVAPDEAPASWDGETYWSTGAFVPGEERDVPLAADLDAGVRILRCALHPGVAVAIAVGTGASTPPASVPTAFYPAGDVSAGVVDADTFEYRFAPPDVTVNVGQPVTWVAGDRAPVDVVFGADAEDVALSHTVPGDGLPSEVATWDGAGTVRSGFLSADPAAGAAARQFTLAFTRPGRYPYRSRFHDGMTGVVIVRGFDQEPE